MGFAATRPALAAAAPATGSGVLHVRLDRDRLGERGRRGRRATSPRTSRTTRPTSCSSTSAPHGCFRTASTGTIDFSNTSFKNASILLALEKAADGYHNCHVKGGVIIEFGNSNYHMSNVGMSNADAWNAGYDQEQTAEDLSRLPGRPRVLEPGCRRGQRHGAELRRAADHEAARQRRHGSRLGALRRLRLGRRLPDERQQQRSLQQRLGRQRRRLRLLPRARACRSPRSTTR